MTTATALLAAVGAHAAVSLLVFLIVVLVIAAVVYWIAVWLNLPPPVPAIAALLVVVIGLLWLVG